MPKVSVIVPNYNHEKFLKGRLDSIVNQGFTDYEIIILDDKSSDNSISIIKKYQKQFPDLIRFVPSNKNSGSPFIQWDKGIAFAKGALIWIAESDDLASTSFLESSIKFFDNHKKLGILVAKSNAIDGSGQEISEFHPMFKGFESKLFKDTTNELNYFEGHEFINNFLVYKCLIPNVSGIIFRKKIYNRSGGLNLEFKRNGDYDLYFRMLQISDIGFLNKRLNSTRYHDKKLTASNDEKSFKELSTILKPVFNDLNLSSSKRLEIMSFYFTVYKYDIFLNDAFSFKTKIKVFNYLSSLSGLLYLKFIEFCLQRLKINISKKITSNE